MKNGGEQGCHEQAGHLLNVFVATGGKKRISAGKKGKEQVWYPSIVADKHCVSRH